MITELLPAGVAAAERYDDPPDVPLFPAEAAIVQRAVPKRRREFATARACAREALAELGLPPVPVPAGAKHEPVWPAGVVGSITHCLGYRAAAVAFDRVVTTIGLDAEPNEPLPEGVLGSIALPAEQDRVAALLRERPAIRWDRLLFSAKESVYKAWFPLTRRWLDFEEADVVIDPGHGTFSARLLVPGPVLPSGRLQRFEGRFLARRGLVLTAIAVPAPARTGDPAVLSDPGVA